MIIFDKCQTNDPFSFIVFYGHHERSLYGLVLVCDNIDFLCIPDLKTTETMSNRKKCKKPPPLPLILPTDDPNHFNDIM